MKGVIYKATNRENKDAYIGQIVKDLIKRAGEHKTKSNRKNTKFYYAIRKYGWDAFEWEVLYFDIPKEQLSNMERWCIANYDTFHNGYNSTEGGEDNPMNNPETRKKVSETLKGKYVGEKNPNYGKHMSEKQRLEISETRKKTAPRGENHFNFGKHLSEETKRKLSEANSDVIFSEEHRSKISKAISGPNNHNFGKPRSEETKKKISETKRKNVLLKIAQSQR